MARARGHGHGRQPKATTHGSPGPSRCVPTQPDTGAQISPRRRDLTSPAARPPPNQVRIDFRRPPVPVSGSPSPPRRLCAGYKRWLGARSPTHAPASSLCSTLSSGSRPPLSPPRVCARDRLPFLFPSPRFVSNRVWFCSSSPSLAVLAGLRDPDVRLRGASDRGIWFCELCLSKNLIPVPTIGLWILSLHPRVGWLQDRVWF